MRKGVKKVTNTLKGSLMKKQMKLTINNNGSYDYIKADKFRIEHVLYNFVSNSIKFSPENSEITIIVDFQNDHSGIEIKKKMTISVKDNGVGITEDSQNKLFGNFVQIQADKLQNGKGSGLGLFICKNLIELHGGNIGVHSIYGKGSTFYFTIPVEVYNHGSYKSSPIISKSNSSQNCEKQTENKKMLLVVDDSAPNRKLLNLVLTQFGFHVQEACNGKEAVEIVNKNMNEYMIIFMDNFMPEMNGIEATKILRKNGYTNMIVGVTGNVMEDDVKLFLDAGADKVLPKPLRKQELQKLFVEKFGSI